VVQLLPITPQERVTSILAVSEFTEDRYLVMLTAGGYIKKTKLSAFANIRANGLIAIALEDDDQLRWVRLASPENTIIVGSRQGMAIRFRTDHQQLRPMGRDTRGVRAMRLAPGDEIVSTDILPAGLAETEALDTEETDLDLTVNENDLPEGDGNENSEITDNETENDKNQGPWVLVVTRNGYGKRVPVAELRIQRRAGKGVTVTKFKSGQDQLTALRLVDAGEELMIITSRGIVMRQATDAITCQSRTARGVRLQKLDKEDAIAAVTTVPPALEDEEGGEVAG
jgi:DNA gyrase subunit A